jgi:diphthamide synthase (EF-2-diphthine--ammonia ligase)
LRQNPAYEVVALFTAFNLAAERVAMHAVRRDLVEAQAIAAGLPLLDANLPWPCSNDDYARIMTNCLAIARKRWQVTHVAFGDLFLRDIREYREQKMLGTGLTPVFPLWELPTVALAQDMLAAGLEAVITCVDPKQISPTFCGRSFDHNLLAALPDGADPCGENGEFHTFVYAGPMFAVPIAIKISDTVERDGFVFTDLMPA